MKRFKSNVIFENKEIYRYYFDACKKLLLLDRVNDQINIPVVIEDMNTLIEYLEDHQDDYENKKYEDWHLFSFSLDHKTNTWVCEKYECEKMEFTGKKTL